MYLFILFALSCLCLAFLFVLQRGRKSFSARVFSAFLLALGLGSFVYWLRGGWFSNEVIKQWVPWLNFIGYGYVNLLRMVSVPLIMISIIHALVSTDQKTTKMGRIVGVILLVLLISVVLAAAIALGVAIFFSLNSNDILKLGETQQDVAERWYSLSKDLKSIPELLQSLIPKNIFLDLAGLRSASIAGVVIFSLFSSWAFFSMSQKEENQKASELIRSLVSAFQKWILVLVRNILQLAPYGIFAIMLRIIVSSNFSTLVTLGKFVGYTYLALFLVFLLHLLILFCFGYSPIVYLKKAWPTLSFAFTSRSSAGTLPMTIETQEKAFGLNSSIASVSASLGTTIGQNGCAGVFPAMLVVMIWNAIGQQIGMREIFSLLGVILISSFGVAGVGGGATFASLMTLTLLGLQEYFVLAVVLIPVEAFIDMGRTLVNVSGSILSGLVTGRVYSKIDIDVYRRKEAIVTIPKK